MQQIEKKNCAYSAVIQHDESDISTWLPLEYDLQLAYGADKVAFSPYLRALKAEIEKNARQTREYFGE